MPSSSSPSDDVRRPLLTGGEKLSEPIERVGQARASRLPFTLEQSYENISPQATALSEKLFGLPPELRADHLVFEATLYSNFLAASHFPERLLQETSLYSVGSRYAKGVRRTSAGGDEAAATRILLLAGPDDGIAKFISLARTPPSGDDDRTWLQLRTISDLETAPAVRIVRGIRPEMIGTGEQITWEAVLSKIGRDRDTRRLQDAAFDKWSNFIGSLGGEVDVKYRREVGDLTFVPIALVAELADEAARFNLLRALRPMPKLRSWHRIARTSGSRKLPVPPKDMSTVDSRPVAVFDGGVDVTIPAIGQFVKVVDESPLPPDPDMNEHGTMVTAALLFGHLKSDVLPMPISPVDHFRIYPPPPMSTWDESLYWILDRIDERVRKGNYAAVNLSIGPDRSVDEDDEPDRWTATLDTLAAETGVLIAVAAGNNGEQDKALGFNRVLVPADMANGMSIGACRAHESSQRTMRARYSAVGPGRPGQMIAPTGVCFGGQVGKRGGPIKGSDAFQTVGLGGEMVTAQGTSLAAPLAMRGMLELAAVLGQPRATAQTLRVFAAHFALRFERHRQLELGHGRFLESYSNIWQCGPNEVTVLYEDSLARGEPVGVSIPLPEGIDPNAELQLTWTIGYQTRIHPSDSAEYTRSGVELVFRPHARRVTVYDAKTDENLGVFDLDADQESLAALASKQGLSIGTAAVADSRWRKQWKNENALRGAGKWETLSRGTLIAPAASFNKPRLDIVHLARESGRLISRYQNEPALAVSMLVTIAGPPAAALYDSVRQQFPMLVEINQAVTLPVRATA